MLKGEGLDYRSSLTSASTVVVTAVDDTVSVDSKKTRSSLVTSTEESTDATYEPCQATVDAVDKCELPVSPSRQLIPSTNDATTPRKVLLKKQLK